MDTRMEQQLNFIVEIDKMKSVFRQSLILDRSRRENDAEHSWHLAMMALLLQEYAHPDVKLLHVLKMLLVHDLVEIYAGDTPAFDDKGNQDKELREQQAAEQLFTQLPGEQGKELRILWAEFEAMETPDSQYAASLDRLQPFLANLYTEGHTWKKLGATREKVHNRMNILQTGLPDWWDFVCSQIDKNVEKGYIKP